MADNGSILVTGAAGQLGAVGRTVTGLLLDRGFPDEHPEHHPEPSAAAALAQRAGVRVVRPSGRHHPADDVLGELFPARRSDGPRPRPHRVPFGQGKTSPVAAADVARVVAAVLADPRPHLGRLYELTGPRSQDMHGVAREYSDPLNREVTYADIPPRLGR